MRSFLTTLLLAGSLLTLGSAQAQTITLPGGVAVSYPGSNPVQTVLNKYEVPRYVQLVATTRALAREVRGRQRSIARGPRR